jgi:hypothetical protein
MGANNWSICPQCKKNKERQDALAKRQLEESYGKVPSEIYLRMIKEFEEKKEIELERTLREDWEIGIYEDEASYVVYEFYVNYRASCEVCGFSFKFKHDEKVELK